jgi:hypothetical protein
MKCPKRHKLLFGLFKIRDKHSYLISNAFYTLEDKNSVDVIRTCQDCRIKDVLTLDHEMVIELVERFPNAFSDALRSYLRSCLN